MLFFLLFLQLFVAVFVCVIQATNSLFFFTFKSCIKMPYLGNSLQNIQLRNLIFPFAVRGNIPYTLVVQDSQVKIDKKNTTTINGSRSNSTTKWTPINETKSSSHLASLLKWTVTLREEGLLARKLPGVHTNKGLTNRISPPPIPRHGQSDLVLPCGLERDPAD